MRAVVFEGVGDPAAVQVTTVPDPSPGASEVLVRLRAAALNHRDVYIRRGRYAGLRFPIIPGSDGVGEIVAVGAEVEGRRVGEQVVINPTLGWGTDERVQADDFRILGLPDNGTLAELVVVPAINALPRPAGLSDAEAAALPLAGLTAYRAVAIRGYAQAGETVLVTGIGGGVATFALLIARQRGARVLVTSGSHAKLARAKELGADAGFNYHDSGWPAAVKAATDGRGPDLIVDGTGGAGFEQILDAARPGGRVVSYGATAGPVPHVTIRRVFWKQLSVLGTTMGSPANFREMLTQFEGGALRPVVDSEFPLEEAGAALARLEQAAQLGKIVLRIG